MNASAREKVLTEAYVELHAALSEILYEEDPLGAGISVGSPRDEYEGEAARLAALLRQTDGDARASVDRMFDATEQSEQLRERVNVAWQTFASRTSQP
jgi:hypothetical protein